MKDRARAIDGAGIRVDVQAHERTWSGQEEREGRNRPVSATELKTEETGEDGGAGFPEQNAPEQGAGRSRGVSSWGVGLAASRRSSSPSASCGARWVT